MPAKVYKFQPRTDGQRALAEALARSTITFCNGPAGTGKTHIAVAHAVDMLRRTEETKVENIVVCRPIVSASGEVGFLPGSLSDKIDPFMQPVLDELLYHFSAEALRMHVADGIIAIKHLGFMRGLNLHRKVVIIDEAQNITEREMHLILTRIGRHSKMVIVGDHTQSDLPRCENCFLEIARDIGNNVNSCEFVQLGLDDIVRSQIVIDIERRFAKRRPAELQFEPHPKGGSSTDR